MKCYNALSIQSCAVITLQYNDIAYISAVTEVQYKSEFESTKDTPYLALMGELWGVFCEDFREN